MQDFQECDGIRRVEELAWRSWMEMTLGRIAGELDSGSRDMGQYLSNYMRMDDNLYIAYMGESIFRNGDYSRGTRSKSG